MKKLLFGLLLLSPWCRAQTDTSLCLPVDSENLVQFQSITQIDSVSSAKELIGRAYAWTDKFYKAANAVVKQFEPDQGMLVLRGMMVYTAPGKKRLLYSRSRMSFYTEEIKNERYVAYQFTIETKTGRYRATLDHMTLATTPLLGQYGIDRVLPACPQIPSNMAAVKAVQHISKEQIIRQENELYIYIKDTVNDLLNDLNASMRQPVAKKDW